MVKDANIHSPMVRDPSPEVIRQRAEAIRSGWSPRERIKRSTWTPPAWLPPLLEMPELYAGVFHVDEASSN